MDDTATSLIALFAVIALGLALGKIAYGNFSLGASGVIFVALAAGHFGFQVPKMAGVVGIVLFVYCLGINAGPSFLQVLLRHGKLLTLMAVLMIGSAAAVAWCVAHVGGMEADLASGLFAGALTSTPALAAATQSLPEGSDAAVGFGVAYPVGVLGVILFVQLAPRFLLSSLERTKPNSSDTMDEDPITRALVVFVNPGIAGRRLRDIHALAHANCQVSRVMVGETLEPIPADYTLQLNQCVLVVGTRSRIHESIDVLGRVSDEANYRLNIENQRGRVVITSKQLVGRSLEQLHLLSQFGVTIARITRRGIEFVPASKEKLQFGDALTAVGEVEGLERFIQYAGHRERALDETDLISLAAGLTLGVLVGRIEFSLGNESFSLGLAGGPLLAGLVLGHFGRIGPIVGPMPRAAQFLLAEIGLALFLAHAGSQAGGEFVSVVRQQGLTLWIGAIVILVAPLIVGCMIARYARRLGVLETLGGICGAMTSTPGLAVITSKVDSSLPATSYAAVYPLALILVSILAPVLVSLMR